jgi:hypothetical protein
MLVRGNELVRNMLFQMTRLRMAQRTNKAIQVLSLGVSKSMLHLSWCLLFPIFEEKIVTSCMKQEWVNEMMENLLPTPVKMQGEVYAGKVKALSKGLVTHIHQHQICPISSHYI